MTQVILISDSNNTHGDNSKDTIYHRIGELCDTSIFPYCTAGIPMCRINYGLPFELNTTMLPIAGVQQMQAINYLSPDKDSLMVWLGTNDNVDAQSFQDQYDSFVRAALDVFDPSRVLLITPPCMAQQSLETPLKYAYRQAIQAIASKYSVFCYDLWAAIPQSPDMYDINGQHLWYQDNLHFNTLGRQNVSQMLTAYGQSISLFGASY